MKVSEIIYIIAMFAVIGVLLGAYQVAVNPRIGELPGYQTTGKDWMCGAVGLLIILAYSKKIRQGAMMAVFFLVGIYTLVFSKKLWKQHEEDMKYRRME